MTLSLEDATSFLYGAGELVHGWQGDTAELIASAAERFPGKPFCLVKRWILIELTASEVEASPSGLPPMIVYAHEVIHDSRRRFLPGYWVRSTYGLSYESPWMFETRNTVYLFVGDGYRKQAGQEILASLFS